MARNLAKNLLQHPAEGYPFMTYEALVESQRMERQHRYMALDDGIFKILMKKKGKSQNDLNLFEKELDQMTRKVILSKNFMIKKERYESIAESEIGSVN